MTFLSKPKYVYESSSQNQNVEKLATYFVNRKLSLSKKAKLSKGYNCKVVFSFSA